VFDLEGAAGLDLRAAVLCDAGRASGLVCGCKWRAWQSLRFFYFPKDLGGVAYRLSRLRSAIHIFKVL